MIPPSTGIRKIFIDTPNHIGTILLKAYVHKENQHGTREPYPKKLEGSE